MGSPLGPLMAKAFMCKIEKQLETESKLPIFHQRFVADTLCAMLDPEAASEFLTTLNKTHPSIDFTMELEENDRLSFLGMNVTRNGRRLDSTVYRNPTDTRLLLHYHSHVDARYTRLQLNTMLNGAIQELKEIFSRLRYPDDLVQSTIRRFIESKVAEDSNTQVADKRDAPVRICPTRTRDLQT